MRQRAEYGRETERVRRGQKGEEKEGTRRAVTGRKREGGKRGARQPYWNRGEGGEFS